MTRLKFSLLILCCVFGVLPGIAMAEMPPKKVYKVLIIDGQNNHGNMKEGTKMMTRYLEETGLFSIEVASTPATGKDMTGFNPDFTNFDVVVSNYNGDLWPENTRAAFEKFIRNGGGLVVIHAADNAFPQWNAYNEMIGIGGWGNRNEKSGPYVYWNEDKQQIVQDNTEGVGGSHGTQHEFLVKTREPNHPIMKGLPTEWLHQKDELYDRLRGPAQNLTVLATAYSPKEQNGSGRNEPMLMALSYGKGRIFHSTLGHENYSQKCIGFITTLQRGTEWAASGVVSQPIPKNFPTAQEGSARK